VILLLLRVGGTGAFLLQQQRALAQYGGPRCLDQKRPFLS
jgi:hypothetical protein